MDDLFWAVRQQPAAQRHPSQMNFYLRLRGWIRSHPELTRSDEYRAGNPGASRGAASVPDARTPIRVRVAATSQFRRQTSHRTA